ncbi:hypothetical protein H6F95_04660 [Cyanobacteria bacterium FACHB-471]|nr:hypothetical protein [Cyanobacteria bacterium FACHB-471]
MKIPDDAIIPDSKLIQHLLIYKVRNDKSKFLAQAGFTLDNSDKLRSAIQSLTKSGEAIEDGTNEYGIFYRVEGELIGVNGIKLPVVIIWLQRQIDNQFQFVTLKPLKKISS